MDLVKGGKKEMEQFGVLVIGILALGLIVRNVFKSAKEGACSNCPLKDSCSGTKK